MKYFVTIAGREIEVVLGGDQVHVDGREVSAEIHQIPGTPLSLVRVGDRPLAIPLGRIGRDRWLVGHRGESYEVEVTDERARHIRQITGSAGVKSGLGSLKAPMPGMVIRVLAAPGDRVAEGQPLVVLEAMKMENELRAPAAAVVRSVLAVEGKAVEKGEDLLAFAAPEGG